MVLFMIRGKNSLCLVVSLLIFLAMGYCPLLTEASERPPEKVPGHDDKSISEKIDPSLKDSCETVLQASKLLISLCTGIFVLVPPFLVRMKNRTMKAKWLFLLGFCFLAVSIFAGLSVILNIAASQRLGLYDIYKPEIWIATFAQLICFALGAIAVGFFLLMNSLWSKSSSEPKYSDAQLRALFAKAEVYKSKEEYEKALTLIDLILEDMNSEDHIGR